MRTATSSTDEPVEAPAATAHRRRRRRLIVGGGLAIVAALAAFVLVYFEPQKLFIDDHVNEPFPVAAPLASTASSAAPTTAAAATASPVAPTTAAAPPATTVPPGGSSPTAAPAVSPTALPAGPVPERAGSFVSLEHGTSGAATIYRFDDGRRVLRIEDLDTSNGPALFVYLSANPAGGPEAAFDDTYIDLGALKGNIGSQNYDIPPEVDLTAYTSVVIWCDRFDAAFGAADLA